MFYRLLKLSLLLESSLAYKCLYWGLGIHAYLLSFPTLPPPED